MLLLKTIKKKNEMHLQKLLLINSKYKIQIQNTKSALHH